MLNRCLRATWSVRPRAARALPYIMPTVQQEKNVMAFQQQDSYKSQQTTGKFNFAHFILLGTAFTSYIYLQNSDMAFAAQPSEKEDSQGTKQNKVRFFGTPHQIFKQFSTLKDDDGEDAMSYSDFYKALTPYNFQKPMDNTKYFKTHSE
jgi:hypothetical protein